MPKIEINDQKSMSDKDRFLGILGFIIFIVGVYWLSDGDTIWIRLGAGVLILLGGKMMSDLMSKSDSYRFPHQTLMDFPVQKMREKEAAEIKKQWNKLCKTRK